MKNTAVKKLAALAAAVLVAYSTPASAQYNPSLFSAPPGVTPSTLYPTLFYTPIQGCDGTTDKRSALSTANGLAAANGAIYIGGGECAVASNITLTKAVAFASGGMLKPANGVTVTFTGSVQAGAYQICDTSAGGHCDFSGIPNSAYVEWWGAIGGSTDYDTPVSTHVINTKAFTEAYAYMPTHLQALNYAYSVTGIINDDAKLRSITGGGNDRPTLIGPGIPYVYAADLPSGDPCATKNIVVQNGASTNGYYTQYTGFGVTTTVNTAIGLAVCAPDTSLGAPAIAWTIQADNSLFGNNFGASQGSYTGVLLETANGNSWRNDQFYGDQCSLDLHVPNIVTGQTALQKLTVTASDFSGTTNAHGILLCETQDIGSTSPFSNLVFDGADHFEFGFDGFELAAGLSVFISPWIERINHNVVNSVATGESSQWLMPGANTAIVGNLVSKLSAADTVTLPGVQYTDAKDQVGVFTGTGSPNSQIFAGRGSIYYRVDGSNVSTSPCFQYSASPANTGWDNAAGSSC